MRKVNEFARNLRRLLYSYVTFYALSQIVFVQSQLFLREKQSILREKSLTNEPFGQKLYKACMMTTTVCALSQPISMTKITVHALII